MRCVTSGVGGSLARARVLAESLKRVHPDWPVDVVTGPDARPLDPSAAPFDRVIPLEELGFPEFGRWMFAHDAERAGDAVRVGALRLALDATGSKRILALDPGVVVFRDLAPLERMLDEDAIVLVPRVAGPGPGAPDRDHAALRHGAFDPGFVAVRDEGEGRSFLAWWRERVLQGTDPEPGRWCDLVPALFTGVRVLRDPGVHVRIGDASSPELTLDAEGNLRADGAPLRSFRLAGGNPDDAPPRALARDLREWYARELAARGQRREAQVARRWERFRDGTPIRPEMRRLYRARPDLQARFPDPFDATSHRDSFLAWWRRHGRDARS